MDSNVPKRPAVWIICRDKHTTWTYAACDGYTRTGVDPTHDLWEAKSKTVAGRVAATIKNIEMCLGYKIGEKTSVNVDTEFE